MDERNVTFDKRADTKRLQRILLLDLRSEHPINEYVDQLLSEEVKKLLKILIKIPPAVTEYRLKAILKNECFERAKEPLTFLKELQETSRAMDMVMNDDLSDSEATNDSTGAPIT